MKQVDISIRPRPESGEIRIIVHSITDQSWAEIVIPQGNFSRTLARADFVEARLVMAPALSSERL